MLLLSLMLGSGSATAAPATARVAAERPASAGKVVYPKLLRFVSAPYPDAARKAGTQGVVLLHLTVGVTGKVTAVSVARSLSAELDAAAVKAAREFVYQPATLDGKAVAATIKVAYTFKLRGQAAPRPRTGAARPAPRAAGPRTRPPPKRPGAVAVPKASLSGRVREKGTRTGLEDAEVRAYTELTAKGGQPRLAAKTSTDKAGRFRLGLLPAGRYRVEVWAAGCHRFGVSETLAAGARLQVTYYVERTSYGAYETVVTGKREQREVTQYELSLPEIQKLPGTQGDALKALQNMPGVARAPFGIGLLLVRGSAPNDTRVFMEGHEIPILYHFLGITSVFNSDLLRSIKFVPGNFSVQYGRATGGIIDVFARKGKRDGWHGYLDVDLWDAGLLVEGPVGKGSIALSLRRSHIDGILALIPSVEISPAYYDYQAMFDHPLWGGHLKVLAFGSDDRMRIYDREADDWRTVWVTLFQKTLLLWGRRWGRHELRASLAGGYTQIEIGDTLKQIQKFGELGWRLHYEHKVTEQLKVSTGLHGTVTWGSGEVPGVGEGGDSLFIKGLIVNQAVYTEAAWKPVRWLTVLPGLRLDFYQIQNIQLTAFDPRLTVRVDAIREKLSFLAAVGLFHQDPQIAQFIPEVGGNPALSHERSLHTALGVTWRIRPSLSIEATGFYKQLWALVVGSSEKLWRDGEVESENVANVGRGRVFGGELLIKKNADNDCPRFLKLEKCFGWISYTLMRSERKNPGDPWRLFFFDQTHILTVVISGLWRRGWQVGLRFRLVSGNPTTAYRGGIFNADGDYYIPVFGERNGDRMPLFHQLDLRVDKKWVFKKWMLSLYLDIQNVYNYQATEFVLWNYNYTKSTTLNGLPIIPSFGLKGEF
ncbi:MAG: TonB family protein [bacterium]